MTLPAWPETVAVSFTSPANFFRSVELSPEHRADEVEDGADLFGGRVVQPPRV